MPAGDAMIELLADLHSPPTALVLILLLGLLGAAIWIGMAALREIDESPPRPSAAAGKVMAGPVLRDGVWCRLVVYPDGHRRVEVLGANGWTASHRNVADLFQAIPGRSGTGEPPRT